MMFIGLLLAWLVGLACGVLLEQWAIEWSNEAGNGS